MLAAYTFRAGKTRRHWISNGNDFGGESNSHVYSGCNINNNFGNFGCLDDNARIMKQRWVIHLSYSILGKVEGYYLRVDLRIFKDNNNYDEKNYDTDNNDDNHNNADEMIAILTKNIREERNADNDCNVIEMVMMKMIKMMIIIQSS